MKRFIKYIVYFMIPIAVFAIAADLLFSYILRNDKIHAEGEYDVWNDIYEGNINADCLIYGSSRAYEHIDPLVIERKTGLRTYNLGLDGQHFFLHRLRHEEYLKHNKKPRYIIYSMDMSTLTKPKGVYNQRQFYPFMFNNKHMMKYLLHYEGFTYYDFFVPLLRYIGEPDLLTEIGTDIFNPSIQSKPCRIRGYHGMDQAWNKDLENAKKKMEFRRIEIDSMSILMFDEFLEKSIDNQIKFIFVYTPQYIEGQEFIINKDSVVNLYKEISKRHKIPFIDYSTDSMSFNKKYFYNSSHMNKIGSQLFSDRFTDYLIETNFFN
ncbi:MAG: hypothetical protein ACLVKO_03510 [Dysgonomonas sp.]